MAQGRASIKVINMTKEFDDSYEVEDGLSLGDMGFFAGPVDPWSVPVIGAPIGSRYFRTDNSVYEKIGVGDLEADWRKITRASFGAAPLTLTFTSFSLKKNDYMDIGKITNSDAAQSVPYDTTLTDVTVNYQSVSSPGLSIKLYIDDVDQGNIITLTPDASPGVQNVSGLSIPINSLTRIKLRGGTENGTASISVVNLVLEAVA